MTQDPLGLAGGVNLYAYAGNNPVNHSDPFGLCDDLSDPKCKSMGQQVLERAASFLSSLPGKAITATAEAVKTIGDMLGAVVPGVSNGAAAATGIDGQGKQMGDLARGAALTAAITEVVLTRPNPGGDGGISRHILEKVDGRTNRVIHQVERGGEIIHQHTTHVGRYGGQRRFPDEWTGIPTIQGP